MATTKNSQGLSFSTIVLAVISIFILVLIILFVSGGLKGTSQATDVYVPGEVESARTACVAACSVVQSTARTPQSFLSSDYCQRTFRIQGTPKNCKDTEIGVPCEGWQIQGYNVKTPPADRATTGNLDCQGIAP